MPVISGYFFFHWSNFGQSLIKSFLKGGQVISGTLINGHYFLHEIGNLAFFFSPISRQPKIFINQNRKNDKMEQFYMYLLQTFGNFALKLLFHNFNLFNQPIYKFFLAIKTINNWISRPCLLHGLTSSVQLGLELKR